MKYKIKEEVWKKLFPFQENPGPQKYLCVGPHLLHDDLIMLNYPLHWFKLEELELVEDK